jgi:hypothetical protein
MGQGIGAREQDRGNNGGMAARMRTRAEVRIWVFEIFIQVK